MEKLPQKMNPHGTAINNTSQQVAGAIGTAVLVTIMTNAIKDKTTELAAEAQAAVANSTVVLTDAQIVEMTAQQAQLAGINLTFMVVTIVSAVALVLAFFLKRVDVTKRGGDIKEQISK